MAIEQNRTEGAISNQKVCDSLNDLLKGEISAVETYRQALEKVNEPSLRPLLVDNSRSHQERVGTLRNIIIQLGGTPAQSSGTWGGFAKLVEGGAKAFGLKAALAALEEGEDHGLRLYKREIDNLDFSTRAVVESELLPAQMRSHDVMSAVKHSVH